MKLAVTVEDRKAAREEIVKLDDLISDGWKGLDAFIKSGDKVPAKAKAVTALEMSKEINACRSYISRGINDLEKLDEKKKGKRIAEMKVRIEKLVSYDAPVTGETRSELIRLGIIAKNAPLQAEAPIAVKEL